METSSERAKRIGGRCFDFALGVFLIAVVAVVWESTMVKASSPITEPNTVAGSATASGIIAAIPLQGTICIVDDSNHNQIQFDSTGAYNFTDCGSNTISGIGTFAKKGSTITLRDVKTDRRLDLTLDTAVQKANMGLTLFSPPRLLTIIDRNTGNDVCGCMISASPRQ
jgi:hypothetical protein